MSACYILENTLLIDFYLNISETNPNFKKIKKIPKECKNLFILNVLQTSKPQKVEPNLRRLVPLFTNSIDKLQKKYLGTRILRRARSPGNPVIKKRSLLHPGSNPVRGDDKFPLAWGKHGPHLGSRRERQILEQGHFRDLHAGKKDR